VTPGGPAGSGPAPRLELGPRLTSSGAEFGVWAPNVGALAVRIGDHTVPLEAGERGTWWGRVEGARAGDDYVLVLDGERERPDPRSRLQPQGPHGPSRLVDLGPRPDPFPTPALPDLVFYELHCGTFTPEGTFDAAAGRVDHLAALGVTAVEVMPVAAFPGTRGWGYDGVDLYAVHAPYGGPAGLRRFVDACHAAGLAVFLDVVYNHLGPDGNYLAEFGPYFSDRSATPWGAAVNLDGPGSDFVRGFVLDNAEMWVTEYGLDGLRLDAVQGLHDASSVHLLEELATRVHSARPGSVVVAESDQNQPNLITGHGIDAIWADDLHHTIHAALTGETSGWYASFQGLDALAKALQAGWVFTGQYYPALDRRHGREPEGLGGERFVVYSQNHDQIGNRAFGERLVTLVGPDLDAVASVLVACSPYLPLLFQGQEWGETRPFLYFTDHGPELARAVRRGRRAEFAAFDWSAEVPDPNDPGTFERSKLDWSRAGGPVLELWRTLLRLRREVPALGNCRRDLARATADPERRLLTLERTDPSGSRALVVASLGQGSQQLPVDPGKLRLRLATRPPLPRGDLSGASAAVWTT
jgi:maltooligosyltrehalose trehalohydrolase